MKKHRLYLIIIIVASVLTYQLALVNPVIALQLPGDGNNSPHYQLTSTQTPMTSIGDEVSTTDPVLLQIIILLGIIVVLVIFIGVWIIRRRVVSK